MRGRTRTCARPTTRPAPTPRLRHEAGAEELPRSRECFVPCRALKFPPARPTKAHQSQPVHAMPRPLVVPVKDDVTAPVWSAVPWSPLGPLSPPPQEHST